MNAHYVYKNQTNQNVIVMEDKIILKLMYEASKNTLDTLAELIEIKGDEVMTKAEIIEQIKGYKSTLIYVYEKSKP